MQVKRLAPTIDSPLSLLRAGGNFAVSAGGSTLSYFQTALDPVAAALAPRFATLTASGLWHQQDTDSVEKQIMAQLEKGIAYSALTD